MRSPSRPKASLAVHRGGSSFGAVFSTAHLRLATFDWHVLALAVLLLLIGMRFVHAMDWADVRFERSDVRFENHLRKVLISLPCLLIGLSVRPRFLRRNAVPIYVIALLLLVLVPLIGQERNNARRWIQLPLGLDLQPSEVAKLALILVLARVLYRRRLRTFGEFLWPSLLVFLPMGMVAMQPDLGTALTIVPMALGMFYLAGARARVILGVVAVGALSGFCAWKFEFARGYQLQRIDTWVRSYDAESLISGRNGSGFHAYHARVAMGNGWLFGTGIGRGVANEAGHLPERDCDSIIAVAAEEIGFLGVAGLLFLYCILIVLLLHTASGIRERFSRLVVGGIAIYFAAHLFINVSVNLGLLPMTGLTLPLLSTGGSSLLVTWAALGLALGLASQREATLDQDAFRA